MEPSPRPFLPPPVRAVTGPPLASPIDLSSGEAGAGKVTVISHVTALERRPHGWTPTGDAGAILLGPVTAALHSLVIRIPGEHRINGLQTSAELQLRYIPEEGTQVALAIPVVSGPDAAALGPILGGVLDVRCLLPAPREVLVYAGTETIPPFQRPTMWVVSRTPLTATPEQLAHLVDHGALPPRHIQPTAGRSVIRLDATVIVLRTTSADMDVTSSHSWG